MKKEKFEKIVGESIEEIPKRFLDKLDNVEICVEERPNSHQLKRLRKKGKFLIFGLYQGVPQTKRRRYGGVLPDKITVFQEPIEKRANHSEDKIKEAVKKTVWHEIAHHFGMDENRVRSAEKKRIIGKN